MTTAKEEAKGTIAEIKSEFEEKLRIETEKRKELEIQAEIAVSQETSIESGVCECCENSGIPKNQLVRIDSGQLICSECFKALRG